MSKTIITYDIEVLRKKEWRVVVGGFVYEWFAGQAYSNLEAKNKRLVKVTKKVIACNTPSK